MKNKMKIKRSGTNTLDKHKHVSRSGKVNNKTK